ncbi:serine/threonine protein kinase [Streptomyces sp. XM83C]|jgi:serine/threonine protein kinase|uniref:Serine/threonine-protein kinase n=1 Tax=Streptomyces thermocoprophilus TaxID=78356 RepID=A0ABV5VLA6_9ACTN|nr:serine/threonine-protein kinase [Streptomyces sp. XM83C]MCK1818459.1 serine/threonine protein kinase [Streptomyces sp. XM83C]
MAGAQQQGQFRPLEAGDPASVAGYRLAARLGSGGMGTVYLSYTPGGHPIALKMIRPELSEDPEFRRRFRQEVQAAQRVQGLYTAPVIDYDTEGTTPWLATAYVAGPSLASAVAEHGPLPLSSVLLLLAGMAEALSVVHGAGIVHRDLKPSNVLLASDGPRVIDFGIARAVDATSLTGTGVSVGTPAFMAPEQAAGQPVTAAADVFALGQVAVYAARGRGAYGDGPSHAVLYRIVHEEPDLEGLPEELSFLARCLAKDPAERPSPAELITLCQAASPTPLRQSGSWLPEPIEEQITQRVSASAALAAAPTAAPSAPPPTAPVTQLDASSAGHAAPTVAAGPATPPPTAAAGPATPAPSVPAGPPTPPPAPVHAAPTVVAGPQPQHPGMQATPPPGFAPGPATPPPFAHGQPVPHGPHPMAGPHTVPGPHPGWQPRPLPPRKRTGRYVGIGIAVVAGLVWLGGCLSVVNNLNDGQDSKSGGSESSAASGGSDGDGSSASPQALPDPEPVTFRGVTIPHDYWIRFADSPPKPYTEESSNAAYGDNAELYYDDDVSYSDDKSPVIGTDSERMVLLSNSEKGSLATCRSVTRYTKKVHLSRLSKGSQLCVHTNSGHIALVTFQGASPENDPSDYITVDLTVWRNAEEPTES